MIYRAYIINGYCYNLDVEKTQLFKLLQTCHRPAVYNQLVLVLSKNCTTFSKFCEVNRLLTI